MAYAQGSIVLVENPYSNGLRPVMVASNDDRPFHGKQYTVAIISTTDRDEVVRIEADDLSEGSINVYPSFVNPWSVHEVEDTDVRARVAQASDDVIEQVSNGIARFHERQP
jgi:mRNA-degrading endonuclease toxin of MazEF toxin-antitoxin module